MYDKGDRAHMENNVIEAIELVMHDAKALEQDFAKMLDKLGSTLFKNKLEYLEKKGPSICRGRRRTRLEARRQMV